MNLSKLLQFALLIVVITWAILSIWREASIERMYKVLMVRHVSVLAESESFKEPEWISKYFEHSKRDSVGFKSMSLDAGMSFAQIPAQSFHALFAIITIGLFLLSLWRVEDSVSG